MPFCFFLHEKMNDSIETATKKRRLPLCFAGKKKPFILAPLAGYTDLPFRLLCRELGADLCVSEMISCHGMVYGQRNTISLLASSNKDRPLGIQLFGGDPEIMGKAAALITLEQADLIDINMGCPVRKVIKKGAGAALMKDLPRAEAIIKEVVKNTALPVTVKFRSGWSDKTINAREFGVMAEQAGAAAVTVHARTWTQAFGGKADWQIIRRVKEKIEIPVIGNGDVLTFEDGQQMLAETGCDGVMIGRGALGNPWVFSATGRPTTLCERLTVMQRYLVLVEQHEETDKMKTLFRVKNHLGRFLSGLHRASLIRSEIMGCRSFANIRSLLKIQRTCYQ
jgi:nifR3 family TIM-barrel protein